MKVIRIRPFKALLIMIVLIFQLPKFGMSQENEVTDNTVNAISTNQYKHVIKIDPLSFLIGYYKIMDEIEINQKISINIIGGYLSNGAFNLNDQYLKLNGFIISPELRIYVIPKDKHAPEGFYFAPWIRFEYENANVAGQNVIDLSSPYTSTKSRTSGDLLVSSFGVNSGIQLITSKFIAIDFFAGIGYGFLNVNGLKKGQDEMYNFLHGYGTNSNSYPTLSQIENHDKIHFRAGVNIGIGL